MQSVNRASSKQTNPATTNPVTSNPATTNPATTNSKSKLSTLLLFAAFVLFFTGCSSVDAPELETQGATKYLKVRVASDQDDAEERASGKVVTSSTDLELTYDVKRGQQSVGVRFRRLAIPRGASIQRAELRFKADETDEGYLKLNIRGDDSDSAAPFAEKWRNLSSRPKTSAAVTWKPAAWRRVGESGGKQYADVTPILQEVVSRKGWQSGNAFALLISSDSKNAKRVAESYRGDKYGAPQLYVAYTLSSTSAGPEVAPAPQAPSPAKSALYVSLSGSDQNDGRAKDKPLKTIARAAQLVRPGDTVYLRGGVYKGKHQAYFGYDRQPFTTDGTKDRPITITSYPGERAIIDGGDRHWRDFRSVSSPELFKVSADHYVIKDLTFRRGAGRGLYLKGKHITVKNVLSHHHHSDGIYFLGDYGTFEDSISHSNYSEQNGGDSADGIKVGVGTGHVVRNFLAYNNSDDGIDIFCSRQSLIERSVAHSNGRGYAGNGNGFKLGCRGDTQSRINNQNTARHNIAYKNRANNFDTNGSGGVTLLHNTSWKAGGRGFAGDTDSSRKVNLLKNNISFQDGKGVGMGKGDHERNNSWNLGVTNPAFVSTSPWSQDFLKLKSASPAVDAGSTMSFDYRGSAPDLGALEYGQSVAKLLGSNVAKLQGGTLKLAQ